jgi:hypothetical protein
MISTTRRKPPPERVLFPGALRGMRSAVLYVLLTLSAVAHGNEKADRSEIERLVDLVNRRLGGIAPPAREQLFTPDADTRLAELREVNKDINASAQGPWSEVTAPRLVILSIRFITTDVALVDASHTQYGPTAGVRALPTLLITRRDPLGWKVASFRVLVGRPVGR